MSTALPLKPITAAGQHALRYGHHPTETARPPEQRLNQLAAGIALDSYLVSAGQPVGDSGYGVASSSTAYLDAGAITTVAGFPTQGSCYTPLLAIAGPVSHWIPDVAHTVNNANGTMTWFPYGGSPTTYPTMFSQARVAGQSPFVGHQLRLPGPRRHPEPGGQPGDGPQR